MKAFEHDQSLAPNSGMVAASTPSATATKRVVNVRVAMPRIAKKRPRRLNELPAVCGIRELAAYLQVGKNTAYELVNTGQIPAVRVGRQYRIRKEAVLEFLGGKK